MTIVLRRRALLLALHLLTMGALALPLPAAAMQILDAADNAELAAEISATGVNRIALMGDRIAKVVRAPDGFAVEHDAGSGDLYLRPAGPRAKAPASEADPHAPVTLFIGTERGFTYRLTLMPTDRDSAQILIRNANAARTAVSENPAAIGGPHIAALVRLVRSVARREPLPGYSIHAARGPSLPGLTFIETWRGPRFGRSCWKRNAPPSRTVRTPPRASPGPSKTCPASGAPQTASVSSPSGWRRPAPVPRADGSPWRWWTRARVGSRCDERPRRGASRP